MSLDRELLAVVEAERARLIEAGPVADPKFAGCFVAFVGMIVLTLTPAVGGWLDIPPPMALGILGIAILLLAGGAVAGLVGGARQDSRARQTRQEALEVLTGWAAGRVSEAEGIRAAVRFLHAGGGLLIDGAEGVPPEARALIGRVARVGLDE